MDANPSAPGSAHDVANPARPAGEPGDPATLLAALTALRAELAAEASERMQRWAPRLHRAIFRPSAENLAYYIALRRRDLRGLQTALMELGLSSLGRCESRVRVSLDAITGTLAAALGQGQRLDQVLAHRQEFFAGMKLLQERTGEMFGPAIAGRAVRIMATLPESAAQDLALVRDLLQRGTSCFRINCAHDTPDTWLHMVHNVRAAAQETGLDARVCMDLCGPRARTTAVMVPPDQDRVHAGDRVLLLTGAPLPASQHPIQIACSVPEVVVRLVPGASVLIDEGKIAGVVEQQLAGGAVVRIALTPPKGARIGCDKGMNFPGTDLLLSPLTTKDLEDLDFVASHADVVGYSFVQSAEDVALLQEELRRRQPTRPLLPLIAKIETERAVRNLPEIMVQGAGHAPLAVMIARGDLAVELGFPRLAEMQEEILWLCEAAHVPVVWATQVLDRMVRKGTPSRAELTDAAMAERAECVMLNKGPYVVDAVGVLHDVLGRMESHQTKKTSRLRALRAWS